MVSCLKCGRCNERDKDVILFQVPIDEKDPEWQVEFLDRLGVQELADKDVYICSSHFLPDDFEMRNSELHLKENALPARNDDNLVELEIRPEVIYFKSEGEGVETGAMSDTSETKDLVPLEPLVEYMNVYEDVDVKDEVEENVAIHPEYITTTDVAQEISIITDGGGNMGVEPVMPFFLTSSPVFTILNENNEVGETIILQIEEDKKQPPLSADALGELQQSLCVSSKGDVSSTYPCDICNNSYGCLNCLKSHYETLHILNILRRYKCRSSHHISKSLVCPVCELMFETRNDTMDHYITHSVGCEVCGSGFDRQSYLTEHYRTAHSKGDYQVHYDCELCKTTYQYTATLAKHYRTFHKMVLCHVCKTRFQDVSELQEHEKEHAEKLTVLPFACSKCDKAFPKISDIAMHIRHEHKREWPADTEAKVASAQLQAKAEENASPAQKKVKVKK
ncbi:hypothetical protein NQ315_001384 [Exocentrus adspersus]|uniref:Uncharacterized protein n=1 Tax=Exocentrus adspersus TaxID=1586481 RepID=A0AAV8WFK2_9CUCU|nr:hypothetical protein NQ315_001384 [Exocentrus adspersus]